MTDTATQGNPTALETAVGAGAGTLRRRLVLLSLVALALLVALAATFAWRQYDAARARALNEVRARVILAGSVFDTYFAGQISTLQAVAESPSVVSADEPAMRAYFERLQSQPKPLFSGGIGWIDRTGISRVSSNPASRPGLNVADRSYFEQVVTTGKPYVSEGLVARRNGRRIIVMAVPSRDAKGRITGVVAGSLLLHRSSNNRSAIDLGYQGLAVLDRKGDNLMLPALSRPRNTDLLARFRQDGRGVFADTRGLEGSSGRVVAFATSSLPAWTTVIDRPRSAVFAAAQHALVVELVLIGAGALLVLLLIVWALRQSSLRARAARAEVRSWTGLTRALAAASAGSDVAESLLDALFVRFTPAAAVVALEGPDEGELAVWVERGPALAGSVRDRRPDLAETLILAYESGVSKTVRFAGEQRPAGRHIRTLHAVPLTTRGERPVGALLLVFRDERVLDDNEQAIVAAHADQAVQALARTRVHERERDAAVTLQRSLLPDRLPTADGVSIAGRYRAGEQGLEVGGDWYDVVRRPDGILHMTVGDVAGHGIAAAARMGELRSAFRAYAFEHTSPAEIARRLSRHTGNQDEMATAVFLTLDPYTRDLRYASAGHPPVVLLDLAMGECRLLGAGAPPLGFPNGDPTPEQGVPSSASSVLIAYTDGLVERRDTGIDAGIARLTGLAPSFPSLTAEEIADRILDEVAGPERGQDDVALLVVRLLETPQQLAVTIPATPSALTVLSRRVDTWLRQLGRAEDERMSAVVAVTAACENLIDGTDDGSVGSIEVTLDPRDETLRIAVNGGSAQAAVL